MGVKDEGVENHRKAFRCQWRGRINDVQVKVGSIGLTRVPQLGESFSAPDMIALVNSQALGLKVRVEGIVTCAEVEQDVVAAHRREGDRNGLVIRGRIIFRYAVLRLDDPASSHGQDVSTVRSPVGVLCGVTPKHLPIVPDLSKVDREPLSDRRLTVDGEQSASM